MNVCSRMWRNEAGWTALTPDLPTGADAALVLLFGAPAALRDAAAIASLRAAFPTAHLFGCSTAGEIVERRVLDDGIVATAVHFDHTRVHVAELPIGASDQSHAVGAALAAMLPKDGLAHVFVLSDGLRVNGSALVSGLTSVLPRTVQVTGGLAGDGTAFGETLVCTDVGVASGRVAVVGLYGERLRVGYGSEGGWEAFGPERRITRSEGNVLYELDGRSALDLYKEYLGPHAAGLPSSALLFPLLVRDGGRGLVRTILSVDEASGSMTFAGDMPLGAGARLMRSGVDRLVDGATAAAEACARAGSPATSLAVLVSCVGRKLVLKQRVEEEVEAVSEAVGTGASTVGFYSYGEIAPFGAESACALHNQTMTVTTFSEV